MQTRQFERTLTELDITKSVGLHLGLGCGSELNLIDRPRRLSDEHVHLRRLLGSSQA